MVNAEVRGKTEMHKPTHLKVVDMAPTETIEQMQDRIARDAVGLAAEFTERLGIMIADAERLSKIRDLPVGIREEVRQVGLAMNRSHQRIANLPKR